MRVFSGLVRTVRRATFYDQLKRDTVFVKDSFARAKKGYSDAKTKEDAPSGFVKATADERQAMLKHARKLMVVFSVVSLLVALYLCITVVQGEWTLATMTIAFLFLLLAHVFKYHFMSMQIQFPERKLNWEQYKKALLRRAKP